MDAGVEEKQGLPVIACASADAWEKWLADHHSTTRGVWLKIAKKATGIATVTHLEALDVALCYGWIDGQRAALDETWFLQRFSPRTATSKWSKVNQGKVQALVDAGRMQAPGLAAVEAAKADGRWERAYDPPSKVSVPEDLQRALNENPEAAAFFDTLDRTNRNAVLYRIHDAKRPETRARRIEQFVAMLNRREKLYP